MAPFEWSMVYGGYAWCDAWSVPRQGEKSRDTQMVRVLTASLLEGWRRYHPLEDTPTLYRTFADVAPTEAGIQAFATRYGVLGLGEGVTQDPTDPFATMLGERLSVWQRAIQTLRATLQVWEVLRQRDQQTLAQWILVEDPPHMDLEKDELTWAVRYPEGSPLQAAVLFRTDVHNLGVVIKERLPAEGSPPALVFDRWTHALHWLQDTLTDYLRRYVTLQINYVKESTDPIPLAMQTQPKHLLGALWLQFALNVRETERDQPCRQCGTWFRVPAKARRASTAYCSARCRMRASRARQRHHGPRAPRLS